MNKAATFAIILTVAPAFSQPSSTEQPKFEIADVHVSPTARGFVQNFGGVLRAGKYINRDATLLDLIEAAYDVKEDGVSGGPGWMAADLFDVIAKVPDGTNAAKAKLMLQSLLADRFGLVIRHGTQPVPRYVLTVGKNGSKLKTAAGTGSSNCQPISGGGPGNPGDLASIPNIKVACHNMTGADIADNLRQMAGGYLDHDVIDSTKLDGTFDFNIEWTPRGALAAKGSDGISIFDAVDKQLGLKLEVQNVPIASLVIEKVNRKPTPNPEGIEAKLALAAARFEEATIKPQDPAHPGMNGGLLYTGGSQMKSGGTLRRMIAIALQISPNLADDMILGLPKSADSQLWDITAKVPSTGEGAPNIVNGRPQPPPLSVGLEMLRGLLVERFELKMHTENREVTVYALTVGGGKLKLAHAEESERTDCRPDPSAPKPATNVNIMIRCKNNTMTELAQNLEQQAGAYIDHPVVDLTGLEGGWDFLIGWTPRNLLQPSPNSNPSGDVSQPSDPSGISVFDAVERELGLKLVKQKRSIPVIVVDHAADKPVE